MQHTEHRLAQLHRTLASLEAKQSKYQTNEDQVYAIDDPGQFATALKDAGHRIVAARRLRGLIAMRLATSTYTGPRGR